MLLENHLGWHALLDLVFAVSRKLIEGSEVDLPPAKIGANQIHREPGDKNRTHLAGRQQSKATNAEIHWDRSQMRVEQYDSINFERV